MYVTAGLVKVTDETSPLLAAGACQAVGEIGRNAPLPLPPGDDSSGEGEITKLSLVKNLLAIIKSGKENTKARVYCKSGFICKVLFFANICKNMWTQNQDFFWYLTHTNSYFCKYIEGSPFVKIY